MLGDRTPAVFLFPNSNKLNVASTVGNHPVYSIDTEGLGFNIKRHVEVEQIYIGNSAYRYALSRSTGDRLHQKLLQVLENFTTSRFGLVTSGIKFLMMDQSFQICILPIFYNMIRVNNKSSDNCPSSSP